ncbi:hypothetical protein LJR016_000660 [Devosia sp. LjRoot16]|uniref:hypothetical protein n=1 Tax=Devosia sp. LjRoot16 TaxID=3342271 RepID=UPI003ECF17F3
MAGLALVVGLGAALGVPPVAAESAHDQDALQMAADACSNQEFSSLLQAMAISDAVVARYSAHSVSVIVDGVKASVPRQSYRDFPIGMLDYYWISRASMQAWEANPHTELVHLQLERNQSPSNQWRIDYVAVRYDGNSSGGDDLGDVVETIGPPGYLLFEPIAGCWELVEHGVGAP